MQLLAWLRAQNITETEFARRVGVAQGTIARYVLGLRRPSAEVMARIRQATNGDVQPNDFYEQIHEQIREDVGTAAV